MCTIRMRSIWNLTKDLFCCFLIMILDLKLKIQGDAYKYTGSFKLHHHPSCTGAEFMIGKGRLSWKVVITIEAASESFRRFDTWINMFHSLYLLYDRVSACHKRIFNPPPGVTEPEYVLHPQPYSGQIEVKVFCSEFELPEDLSPLISKISQDAVAQEAFGDVWKCHLSYKSRNIKVCVRRAWCCSQGSQDAITTWWRRQEGVLFPSSIFHWLHRRAAGHSKRNGDLEADATQTYRPLLRRCQ